jgi:hypothetical protein
MERRFSQFVANLIQSPCVRSRPCVSPGPASSECTRFAHPDVYCEGEESGCSVNEQEARKVFSHVVSLYKVFGGDLVKMCAERGLPEPVIKRLIAEQKVWDWGLSKFDWDGSIKKGAG